MMSVGSFGSQAIGSTNFSLNTLSQPAFSVGYVEEETFKEKIAKLSELHSRNYPSSWELYTSLQIAVIFGDLKQCEQLIQAGVNVDEEGEVRHHPLVLAYRNEEIVNLLFSLSCASSQTTLLSVIFIDGHFILWEQLWTLANKEAKSIFLTIWYEIGKEKFDTSFQNTSNEFQRMILLSLSRTTSYSAKINDVVVKIFRSLFEKAASEIRNQQELSAILEEMNKRDDRFTEELTTCSLFGHRFSLKGEQFEGLNIEQTSMLSNLIAKSLKTVSCNENKFLHRSPKMISATIEALDTDKSDPEFLSLRSLKKPSIVPCGWNGHSVVTLFSKNIVVKINTARNSDNSLNGVAFYVINNRDNEVRTNAIKTLIQYNRELVPAQKGFEYFTNTLSAKLEAELLTLIPFAQKSGNCAWSASKLTVLALFILFDMKAEKKVFSREAIEHSFRNVASAFVEWDTEDCIMSVSETVPLLKKYPILYNLEQIKSKILELFNPNNFDFYSGFEVQRNENAYTKD